VSDSVPQRPRPGPRRGLTAQAILETALRLVDAGGADALSVRSVAAELGVAPNALYTYFRTKAELVAALADLLLGRLDLDAAATAEDWRSAVGRLAADLRATLLAHPGVVPLLLRSGFTGPRAVVAGEVLLGLLVRGGLSGDEAARASYLLQTYVLGTVALDAAELPPGTPRPDDAARTAERRRALGGVDAAALPHTAATADVVAAYNSDEQFHWGLDHLLDGIVPAGR
jgi:TetR/AcrR family transcriptional regulator, tetracycline repressor protein